jgi:glutamate-1-semialdehyde 2,1-aminomutase
VIDEYRLPANVQTLGAKGSITYRPTPVREYRDGLDIDDRPSYLAWLWQLNRGVFKSPWAKWESWTTSIAHTDEDARRYVDNFAELAGALTSP